MIDTPAPETGLRPRRRRRARSHYRDALSALTIAALAYLVALLVGLLVVPHLSVLGLPSWVLQIIAFALTWTPLIVGVYLAGVYAGENSLKRDTGFTMRPIDLGIGLLLGIVLRFTVEGIAPTHQPTGQMSLGEGTVYTLPPMIDLLVVIIGAALIAPIIEELFFRGLLQRGASGLVRGNRALRIGVAVIVSTPLFVLLHLVSVGPASWGTVAITTGVSGLVFGLLAATTRRLGPSITTHIVFNAVGLVIYYVR